MKLKTLLLSALVFSCALSYGQTSPNNSKTINLQNQLSDYISSSISIELYQAKIQSIENRLQDDDVAEVSAHLESKINECKAQITRLENRIQSISPLLNHNSNNQVILSNENFNALDDKQKQFVTNHPQRFVLN